MMKEKGKEPIMDYYVVQFQHWHPDTTGKYAVFCEECIEQFTKGKKEKLTEAQKAGLDVQCDSCGG